MGIVAGNFDALRIGKVIDRIMQGGLERSSSLNHNKAMILNGQDFTYKRLYLFPNHFMMIPTETPTSLRTGLIPGG